MNTTRRSVAIILLAGLFAVQSFAAAPSSQPTNAIDAAKQYCDLLKAGKGSEALDTFWDLDAMFVTIFGDNMKNVSDTDRAEMRRQFKGFLMQAYANPQILTLMATAKFTNFTSKDIGGGRQSVTFDTVLNTGKVISNVHVYEQLEGHFKIVDGGAGGLTMGGAAHDAYMKVHDQITPPAFVKALTSGQ